MLSSWRRIVCTACSMSSEGIGMSVMRRATGRTDLSTVRWMGKMRLR